MNKILVQDYEALKNLMDSNLRGYEKVIVLGCTGMLGFYITSILVQYYAQWNPNQQISVVGVCREKTVRIEELAEEYPETFISVHYDHFDNDFEFMGRVLVIHAASPSSIQSIKNEPLGAIETNIELTIQMLKLLERNGGHIVFFSSGEVYGDSASVPTTERDYAPINHLEKRGLYPEMKRSAEVILKTYCDSNINITATSFRIFHTFGPGLSLDDPRIFGVVCRAIQNEEEIVLETDGSSIRVFMYTRDLMSAILYTLGDEGFNYYNVAGNDPISIADFCRISLDLGVPNVVLGGNTDTTPRNAQIGFADTGKLEALGWRPEVSVFEGLQRTSGFLRK